MGSFLNEPVCALVPGRAGSHVHWFGGKATHHGTIPSGRKHPVHLLYELDLTDPALGLWSRFPGRTRLPLYNALQYNCCAIVYRVVSDTEISILAMDQPGNSEWDPNFPFDKYPRDFRRTPIHIKPLATELTDACIRPIGPDGGADNVREHVLQESCLFPRVGGRHFMWQGIPEWACPTQGCQYFTRYGDVGKEVFAVVWERPVPELHLWSDDPEYQDLGSVQIIFSRCTGCGVIHSCNRSD
jgi:hypothetical protein